MQSVYIYIYNIYACVCVYIPTLQTGIVIIDQPELNRAFSASRILRKGGCSTLEAAKRVWAGLLRSVLRSAAKQLRLDRGWELHEHKTWGHEEQWWDQITGRTLLSMIFVESGPCTLNTPNISERFESRHDERHQGETVLFLQGDLNSRTLLEGRGKDLLLEAALLLRGATQPLYTNHL